MKHNTILTLLLVIYGLDFRSDFLKALSVVGNDPSRGWFVNNCFTHGQCEFPSTWFGNPSSKLNHMVKIFLVHIYDSPSYN